MALMGFVRGVRESFLWDVCLLQTTLSLWIGQDINLINKEITLPTGISCFMPVYLEARHKGG